MSDEQPRCIGHQAKRKRRRAIADAIAQGDEPHDVAQQFGVCFETVRSAAQDYGTWPNHAGVRMAKHANTLAILSTLQNTQLSLTEVARRHGCSKQNIHRIYHTAQRYRINIPMRLCGRPLQGAR